MTYPTHKYFRIVPNDAFDYVFQYLVGTPISGRPVDLTAYQGLWTVIGKGVAPVIYTCTGGTPSGRTGVEFGGQNHTPTNGMITMRIHQADLIALTWMVGRYTLDVVDDNGVSKPLLEGGIGITN